MSDLKELSPSDLVLTQAGQSVLQYLNEVEE